jgi:hypothetical protein
MEIIIEAKKCCQSLSVLVSEHQGSSSSRAHPLPPITT